MLEIVALTIDWPDFSCRYDLTVPKGALCVLIGPSGGGKTTLINAIAGFGRRPNGCLLLDGQDLLALEPAQRPLSILFQEHNLFPHLTAEQNVGLGLHPGLHLNNQQREVVGYALASVGLADMGSRYPAELSGGQRQRVALARAMIRNKPLMLLDEPFAALDPVRRRGMIHQVDKLRREQAITVLMSIHTPEEIEDIADMIVTIAEGRVQTIRHPPAQETISENGAPEL